MLGESEITQPQCSAHRLRRRKPIPRARLLPGPPPRSEPKQNFFTKSQPLAAHPARGPASRKATSGPRHSYRCTRPDAMRRPSAGSTGGNDGLTLSCRAGIRKHQVRPARGPSRRHACPRPPCWSAAPITPAAGTTDSDATLRPAGRCDRSSQPPPRPLIGPTATENCRKYSRHAP